MKKIILSIALLALIAISRYSVAPRLRAAGFHFVEVASATQAGICEFQKDLQDLSRAQKNTLANDSSDNIKTELSLRKSILSEVINCAINDAITMQSSIKPLAINDPDIQAIQNRLLSKFNDVINYYRFQKTLVGDLGLEGSKKFSMNLKGWRNSNYEALFELGTNFIIFSKNQELMRIAGNRFDQIKRTLQVLTLTDNETIRTLLQSAESNFGKAREDNSRAQDIFKSLSWPNDSSNLITSSLEYLKETYQNFFDIRNEMQTRQ